MGWGGKGVDAGVGMGHGGGGGGEECSMYARCKPVQPTQLPGNG